METQGGFQIQHSCRTVIKYKVHPTYNTKGIPYVIYAFGKIPFSLPNGSLLPFPSSRLQQEILADFQNLEVNINLP